MSQKPADRFTQIPNAVLAHAAYRTASLPAKVVLFYLAARCYGAKDNGRIVFANRSGCLVLNPLTRRYEEKSIGLSRSATGKALRDLEDRGLIACTRETTMDQKRLAKTYRLTWMPTKDGDERELPTREYLSFDPDKPLEAKKRRPSKTKRRPPTRPVPDAIGHPRGKDLGQSADTPDLQATHVAYGEHDRPPTWPLCNHVQGSVVSEAVLNSPAARAARAPLGSARSGARPADLRAALAHRLADRNAKGSSGT